MIRIPTFAFVLYCLFVFPQSSSIAIDETKARTIDQSLELAAKNKAEIQKALKECNQSPLETKSIRFLVQHMPPEDLQTLSSKFLVENVRIAIKARNESKWAQKVPEDIFLNDVLPYASINERRDNWRQDFYSRFRDLVKDCNTPGEAAQELNKNVFAILKVRYSTKRKKPDQSPYESMENGLASCTGLSVILTDACRAVGVPARMAGTPLWVNKRGNHTWVEVWDEGHWKFTGACEYDKNGLNRGWFKGIASQANPDDPRHRIYATSFRRTGGHFPMVWKRRSKEVPGVDVTWRYIGKPKPANKDEVTVAIQLIGPNGKRLAGKISVGKDSKVIAEGKSRDESNDANDYFELNLTPGEYEVKYESKAFKGSEKISVNEKNNQIHRIRIQPKK